MKMELVKTTSFDEFMTEYYELNNNLDDTKNSVSENEHNDDKNSTGVTRREFLKYSALGTATVIMGASTEKAEAFFPVIGLIVLGASAWASTEYIDWEITIGNGSNSPQAIPSDWEVVNEEDYNVLDSSSYTFYVPSNKARTYRNKSLKADVMENIYALIQGNIGNKSIESSSFRIYSS